MRRLTNWVLFVVFALVLTGCGGGGGATPNTPSGGVLIAGLVDLKNSNYSASVRVTNSNASGATIADAIVAVNGVTVPYNPATQWYEGSSVAPDASGKFKLSVTVGGFTYIATESALTSAPVITMPATFTAAAINPISWTVPGGATSTVYYFFGITNKSNGTITSVYAPGSTTATSADIPANTTIKGGSYSVGLAAMQTGGGDIPNAAPGSSFAVWAWTSQIPFTAQ